MANRRVLLVDDDLDLLHGLRRQLRGKFHPVTACGVEEGLRILAEEPEFAVVVSDYQMPGMNGAEFLATVQEQWPDAVRIMLTGQADQKTAVHAVNRGRIFRFINKPCDPELLLECLDAGVEMHRLRNAEEQLLEQTVQGAIGVLSDVLALTNPAAFGRARRIQNLVKQMVEHLQLTQSWQYETAALLSQVGLVAVPDAVLERWLKGGTLTEQQSALVDRHPEVGRDLIARIPRLEDVAEMVLRQGGDAASGGEKAVALGGRLLAAAIAFDDLTASGVGRAEAVQTLTTDPRRFEKGILQALAHCRLRSLDGESRRIPVRELRIGMVLGEDICNTAGGFVAKAGLDVTEGVLSRLRNYAELGSLACEDVLVCVDRPARSSSGSTPAGTTGRVR